MEKRQQIASAIAKKGSAEDITQYQTVYSGKIITVIEPTKYPDKVPTLAYCAYLSDYCVVIGEQLNAQLGEIIVTLDLLGKKDGCLITNLDLGGLIRGTALEKYDIFSSFDEAKEKILAAQRHEWMGLNGSPAAQNEVLSSVDHSFEVKGVGSIVLGFLHSGKISVHDKLSVHPSGKELEVRSIQMHDQDVKETNGGDRFGLAIKLLASKDVERGDFLTSKDSQVKVSKEPEVKVTMSKFTRDSLKQNEQIHVFQFLGDAPCRWQGDEIAGGKEGKGKLTLEKPFALHPDYPALIVRLDAKGLRVIGKAVL